MLRVSLACARLRRQRVNAHLLHERSNMQSSYRQALPVKLAANLSGSHEGKLKMQLINGIHELQISCAHGSRKVIHRSSADSQQLGLAANTQRVVSVNHLLALSNPALVSALFKKSNSSACCLILACKSFKSTVFTVLPGGSNTHGEHILTILGF